MVLLVVGVMMMENLVEGFVQNGCMMVWHGSHVKIYRQHYMRLKEKVFTRVAVHNWDVENVVVGNPSRPNIRLRLRQKNPAGIPLARRMTLQKVAVERCVIASPDNRPSHLLPRGLIVSNYMVSCTLRDGLEMHTYREGPEMRPGLT